MSSPREVEPLVKKQDFKSATEPRWCSGCGDYFIYNAFASVLASLDAPRENFLLVSGIGCSSRFPYYMETYGFHTIHGRAPTVALGAKIANPKLSVWVITGDGDALSIGGNHFIHLLRRNHDVKVILFNNEIYGLTKGQASPTSKNGLKTPSSPLGSLDQPFNPLALALVAGASFVARVVDTNPLQMKEVFRQAYEHKGSVLIEAYTNCLIFNDGAFTPFEKRSERAETTIEVQTGQPLVFGSQKDKALIADGLGFKVIQTSQSHEVPLTHDASNKNMALLLASMHYPDLPLPVGVLYKNERPTYEEELKKQEDFSVEQKGLGDLESLFHEGEKWDVEH